MTEEVTTEEIEAAQRAVMLRYGCGIAFNGERVFCDDPRVIESLGAATAGDDCVCKCAGRAALLAAKGAASSLQKRPVAFRAKDALDQWILFDNEDDAASYATDTGFEYQGLYARDASAPAPSPDNGWLETLNRYRYAVAYAAADAWDGGKDIRHRFEWARALDTGAVVLTNDDLANIGQEYLKTERCPLPPPPAQGGGK